MRVLWLSHFLPYPPKGGMLQRSYNLLKQAAAKHEVHLVALNQRAVLQNQAAISEAVDSLSAQVASLNWFGIPSERARWRRWLLLAGNYANPQPYDVNWLRSREVDNHLRELGRGAGFDLIHVDTIGLWPYTRWFSQTPAVLNHHNIESHMMARRAALESRPLHRHYFEREARKLRAFEKRACRDASTNLVVSALDARRLEQIVLNCRTTVVANGVDVDYFCPSAQEGQSGSMVFAGGMNWYPNLDAALFFVREIWPGLVAANPNRTVTFVGQTPPRELAQAGDARIRAPGFVDDVRPYIASAQIYVCPIRDGGGTRLKILDALAMGKPIVATDVAVEGLDLLDGQHYLRANTPAEFVGQIGRLEADATLRRRLSTTGREVVKTRFSWAVVGQALEDAYQLAART